MKTGFLLQLIIIIGSNRSNLEGLFYAGTCTAPMNITETISHARAAVTEVVDYLKKVD